MRPLPERTEQSPMMTEYERRRASNSYREVGERYIRPKPKCNPGSPKPAQQKKRHSRYLWLAPVWCGIVLGVAISVVTGEWSLSIGMLLLIFFWIGVIKL